MRDLTLLMGRALLALPAEVAEGLASVVNDLAGALDELMDEGHYIHRLLVLVEVTGLALFIAEADVLCKEAWINSVHDLEKDYRAHITLTLLEVLPVERLLQASNLGQVLKERACFKIPSPRSASLPALQSSALGSS
jgi:hypothetical protein